MKFADLASGSAVFVDANTFVYAFAPIRSLGHPAAKCSNALNIATSKRLVPLTFSATSPIA